jgi:hypothetical protein
MSIIVTTSRRSAARLRARRVSAHGSPNRRRQMRKARAGGRKVRCIHQALPQPAHGLVGCLAGAWTRLTFLRLLVLSLATILTSGPRTACALLRTLCKSGQIGVSEERPPSPARLVVRQPLRYARSREGAISPPRCQGPTHEPQRQAAGTP